MQKSIGYMVNGEITLALIAKLLNGNTEIKKLVYKYTIMNTPQRVVSSLISLYITYKKSYMKNIANN